MPINVAIVDDHPIVAEGLCNILKEAPHISVVASYSEGNGLMAGLAQQQPDILLLDMQLPGRSGSGLAMDIIDRYPDIHILVLSGMETHLLVKNMIQIGCRGYMLKQTANKYTLVDAIESVYKGELYIDPLLKDVLLYDVLKSKKQEKKQVKLSKREHEILRLIADEYSNAQIADKLFVSLRTVESHKYNLCQKLSVKNPISLIKTALKMGLLH